MPSVADVVAALERFAPLSLAAEWDNVGLLLGDRGNSADRVLTCLTLTNEVADEAVADGSGLIVTHHPILFRGVKRIIADTAEGQMLLKLARAGIAVYSPHTAFDNTVGGINDRLATRLGLTDVKPLRVAKATQSKCKLVTFVPDADLAKVSDALFVAGAGQIGDYRECSFRVTGTGTFFGGDATQPKVGQKGRREEVTEWRLEVVCPTARLAQLVTALRTAHSYEEPAYDIIPLVSMPDGGGEGRLGTLKASVSLSDFGAQVRAALGCGPVQVVGDPAHMVSRIAVACGAAGEFLKDAQGARCDVLMTGEMRFHDYLAARASGVGLVLPGHYATERFAVEDLAEWLNAQVTGVQARVSRAERDPVSWN